MNEHERYEQLMQQPNAVFVFGSNLAGRHGKGAAKVAHAKYGAVYGNGAGWQGRSYAIPTKDERLRPLALGEIRTFVAVFLAYAEKHPDQQFIVTRIGCGLAGYTDEQIAPFFANAPSNVVLPEAWQRLGLSLAWAGREPLPIALQERIVWAALEAFVQGADAGGDGRYHEALVQAWYHSAAARKLAEIVEHPVIAKESERFWATKQRVDDEDDGLPF